MRQGQLWALPEARRPRLRLDDVRRVHFRGDHIAFLDIFVAIFFIQNHDVRKRPDNQPLWLLPPAAALAPPCELLAWFSGAPPLCLFCLFPPLCLPRHSSPRLGYCIPRGKLSTGGKSAHMERAPTRQPRNWSPLDRDRLRDRHRGDDREASCRRLSGRTPVTMRWYRLDPTFAPHCGTFVTSAADCEDATRRRQRHGRGNQRSHAPSWPAAISSSLGGLHHQYGRDWASGRDSGLSFSISDPARSADISRPTFPRVRLARPDLQIDFAERHCHWCGPVLTQLRGVGDGAKNFRSSSASCNNITL